MPVQTARERLLALLRRDAVLHGDFVLSSGRRSSYYLDARRVTLSAAGSSLVAEVLLEQLESVAVDAVAGLTVGADPIVASLATVAGQRGLSLDGLIVRKEGKSHGLAGRVVGPWRPEMRVAVVDDTLTTGASSLTAAQAIEEAGGRVVGVWALIDRDQGARDAIERAGYSLRTVYRADEILEL